LLFHGAALGDADMNANGKMLVVLFALLAVASLGIWLFLSKPHRAELCSRDDLVYAPSVAGDGSLTYSGDQQSSASGGHSEGRVAEAVLGALVAGKDETSVVADSVADALAGAGRPSVPGLSANASGDQPSLEQIRSAADILAGANMQDSAVREQVSAQLRRQSELRREEARRRADAKGIPVRMETPDGQVVELQGFDGDRPLYYTTHNRNAAISAAVPALYEAPYAVNGALTPVGVWDAGSVRSTHQEMVGRVNLLNSGAQLDNHATHVAGTIAAAGVQVQARGMAPAANIYSLDWNNDLGEMAQAGAATATDTERLPISNHSYGIITGYAPVSSTRWRWYGTGQGANDVDQAFGRYHTLARDWDALVFSLPYYSIFKAAGNDRTDNPSTGDRIDNPWGSFLFTYDPALHPKGDGVYRGGYESISYAALAKNVITVGAVEDAVSDGARSLAQAGMSAFASWGPTDDGRIKPDIVANGVGVYSPLAGGDAAYGNYSGTSMASPSAAGAATLLLDLYRREFSGRIMPASLLKALLIHTADDLGTPGPDYRYGWGLIHAERAASLLMDHVQNPGSPRLVTGEISAASPAFSYTFEWDGVAPIRVTLSWTDPAGPDQAAHDSRTPVLVHDLDLVLVSPNGQRYLPFVMPFVGTWTVASMSQAATTGTNRVDNVEQVYVASPALAGEYVVEVSLSGSLTTGTQPFSLVVSGVANATGDTRVLDLLGDLHFGSMVVGTTSNRTVQIRNLGNAPLTVSGLETPDGFSASWSGVVAPGGSQVVSVQFSPSQPVSYTGALRVLSDATAGADTLSLSGRGIQSLVTLENGVAITGLGGAQNSEQYFVLSVPTGQERLAVSIAGGNGGDADLYVRHAQLPTLGLWDFRPYLEGSEEDVVVDNPASGNWYVMVHGFSAYTNLTLTATYTPPPPTRVLAISGSLAFGNIPVGDSVARTVTLRNDGTDTLTIDGIALPAGFSGGWSGSIPSGASQDVAITFEPVLELSYSGVMTVSSDKTSGDEELPVSGNGIARQPVYRFWSDVYQGHFYTISKAERDLVMASWPDVWRYEGGAWYAYARATTGTSPVYRFWSPIYNKHFFTISRAERDQVIATWPLIWKYEGVAWYAYASAGAGRSPVYRFWSPVFNGHFFTISAGERDHILATWPDTWTYEGVAYYTCPASTDSIGSSMVYDGANTALAAESKDAAGAFAGLLLDPWQVGTLASESRVEAGGESSGADVLLTRSGDGVYFPLRYTNTYVAASVYDPELAAWEHVLAPSWEPDGVSIGGSATNRNWLAVLTYDAAAEAWGVMHGSWFGRLLQPAPGDPDLAILGDVPTDIGLPVEALLLPEEPGEMLVLVYDVAAEGYVETIPGLKGGARYDWTVPQWNRWYRLDIVREKDGEVLQSQWVGHMRTH
jgi:subtilisin family serine protease